MHLRISTALVAVLLGTSALADDSALHPTNFVDCREETYVAQVVATDLTGTSDTTLVRNEDASDADRIAALIDSIIQNTVVVGNWLPLLADEPETTVASSFASDPSDVTGSTRPAYAATDGLEDR